MKTIFTFLLSFLIVAFGQPSWLPFFAPIAACLGYGLFWSKLIEIGSPWRRFTLSLVWFFLVQLIQLSWMATPEYQGGYIIVVYLALCLWLAFQFGAVSLCVNKIPHIGVAALWTLIEWARLYFLCGFSWNLVGLSLTAFTPSLQMASVFGILGLSFWVILTNLAFAAKKWKAWAVFALIPYIFGGLHLAYHLPKLRTSQTLSVGLVQTGLYPEDKTPFQERKKLSLSPYDQWGRILTFLTAVQKPFDLIVLPECVVPVEANRPFYHFPTSSFIFQSILGKDLASFLSFLPEKEAITNCDWLKAIANCFSAEVVAGLDADEGKAHFSSAFHVLPQTENVHRYEKQVLVPLAEYLPFPWLKHLTSRYGITEFFTHGKEAKVFPGKVPLSISICYEETFPHIVREGRSKGAQLLVNVTNDGWYPNSKLPKQHFTHGRVRSVENGAPLIRSCNTGVSAALDSLGQVVAELDDETVCGVLTATVPTYHYATLYTLWGNWAIVLLSLGFLGIALYNSFWKKSYL